MNHKLKRGVSLLLSLVMVLTLLPATALAADALPSVEITNDDGVTITYSLDAENQTAAVTNITVDSSVTSVEVTIPGTITYPEDESEGEEQVTYTVTELKYRSPYIISSSDKITAITALTLPETLESVNSLGFSRFPNLTTITIPGSVKDFNGTFQNMTKLTSVTFKEGVETISNTSNPFGNCSNLTEINLPDSLTTISTNCFARATALTEITLPAGITELPDSAFEGCTALESVTIEGELTSIPYEAFSGCTKLKTFTVAEGSKITSVGDSAFYNCQILKGLPLAEQLTSVGKYAFAYCYYLDLDAELDLSSLDEIPDYAFCYAGYFANYPDTNPGVTITRLSDSLRSIGAYALAGCAISGNGEDEDGEATLTFPDTLTSIGNCAFYYSSLPDTVIIPAEEQTTVGTYAFSNTSVKQFEIGEGLTEINANAFQSTGLESITFDNSQDDIEVTGSFPANITVKYLKEPIGDVGDKISEDENSKTLQEAVDAAAKDETITISKNVVLDATLNIRAGKDITISTDGDEAYTIIGDKTKNLDELIKVEEGASVTFGGSLILSGRYNSGSIISNSGSVTLADSVSVKDSSITDDRSGVIVTSGKNAHFTMNGGTVEDNKISKSSYSGVIRVFDGGSVSMSGGTIQNNKVIGDTVGNSSSGILLYGSSSGEMTGGDIKGNSAFRGSAIMLYSYESGQQAEFTLTDGTISGNACTGTPPNKNQSNGGTVLVEGYAKFTMEGGSISGNTAEKGAGVAVVDPGIQKQTTEYQTAFTMTGGTISGNTAAEAGGGIYSYSNCVHLAAGTISGNKATLGGGIYSEGNNTGYSTLYMENAVITKNTAAQGGGMWFCPTGGTTVYINEGGIIYNNTAAGAKSAGDDIAAASSNDYTVTLADRVLGGGKVLWYQDGRIFSNIGSVYTEVNQEVPRYQESTDAEPITVDKATGNLGLKAVIGDSAAQFAESKATLFITGNSATYGGGVGANGGVMIGSTPSEGDLKDITVEKRWEDSENPQRPGSVTVDLYNGTAIVDTAVLSEENNWTYTFKNLPVKDSGGEFTYTVREQSVPGYQPTIETSDTGYTITNTYTVRYTVTYTDGVEGEEVFPDQKYSDLTYGSETPAFEGTPTRPGYEFTGWSPEVADTVTGDVTYVAQWKRVSYPPIHPVYPGKPASTVAEPEPTVNVKGLNTVDHVAYIIGVDTDRVNPLGTITRAEIANIYFRLMTDEFRNENWSTYNRFNDVPDNAWYTMAVLTLDKAGVITDADDGNFRPNDPITRAELAVMAAQFCTITGKIPATTFQDVPADHWALEEITLIEYAGWIVGYDGYFRPDENLTRAEAMTIVNRILQRGAEDENMLPGMITWSDNANPAMWYYDAIQEATNSHDYTRTAILLTDENFYGEKWTALLQATDWEAMERAWIEANS